MSANLGRRSAKSTSPFFANHEKIHFMFIYTYLVLYERVLLTFGNNVGNALSVPFQGSLGDPPEGAYLGSLGSGRRPWVFGRKSWCAAFPFGSSYVLMENVSPVAASDLGDPPARQTDRASACARLAGQQRPGSRCTDPTLPPRGMCTDGPSYTMDHAWRTCMTASTFP